MTQNIFIKCVDGIVKEAYAGGDSVKYDWNTAIDIFNAKYHITAALGGDMGEVARQRGEFISWVKNRKFDKNGKEIKRTAEAPQEYEINGRKIKIDGGMIKD